MNCKTTGASLARALVMLMGVVWLSALALDARAQQTTVRGYVTDTVSEQALQGASVVLQDPTGAQLGTATDGDGYFIIRRVPPGPYTLFVTFIGYAPFQEDITLTAGQELERQIALAPQEAELEEVLVEAEQDEGITAVAAGLQTVQPAQIERVPMPGVTGDLATYLQTVPGIVVQGDRGGQYFVRGGSLDQNLALIDGLPIYMPFHLLSFYSAFPQEIIDEADVYTGGYGAQYGTRISSVMDVRTRKGNKQNFSASASLAPFLSTAHLEVPLIKNKVSFFGSVRQSLLEEAMPNMFGQRWPYRFGDQFAKLHAFINSNNSFSVTFLNTFDEGQLAGSTKDFTGETITVPPDSNEVSWTNTVIGGKYTFIPSRLPILAELSGGYSEMNNDIGPKGSPDRASKVKSLDLALHFTYFLDNGAIRFGGTGRRSDLSYALGGQFQDLDSAQDELTEISAYIEGDLPIASANLQIQPGLNFYVLPDRSQQWLEPRLRATWRPGGATSRYQIHASGGIYHQVIVGLNDERDIGNLFTAWVATPEDVPAPEAIHAIVGATIGVTPWLSIATEGFYKSFSNLSVPIFSAFPRFTTALQPADGEAKGIDVRLDMHDRPFWNGSVLDGYFSYTLSEVVYETEHVRYHPAHDRRHQLNALVHAQWGEVGVTVQWQYGTGLPFTASSGFDVWHLLTPDVDVASDPGQERVLYADPFGGRQPSYTRFDAWIERRFEHQRIVGTLRAGVINLFNRDNLFYYDLFTLQRVDQLPLTPSIGFKVEFR